MSEPDPTFRHCPVCAGALRPLRADVPPAAAAPGVRHLRCERCGFVLYQDPKVAAGAIIHPPGAPGEVVLVRRAIDPGYGRWVFPGGYVDRGEPVEDAAAREAREECGLEIRLDALIGVYSYRGRTPVVIVYAATWMGGVLAHDEESLEARVFARAEVPWDALAFTSTRQALEDYFAGRLHPGGVRESRGTAADASRLP